ncbi:MAG: hypothetical protein ACFFG0_36650 [Candidatus Thorarchaeota archaeon]
MKVKQEIHCHNCNCFVQFELDMSLDGNHVFECPNCGHEHCQVVRDGIITGERWEQKNGATNWGTYTISATSSVSSNYIYAGSTNSTSTTGTMSSDFITGAWANFDSSGGNY